MVSIEIILLSCSPFAFGSGGYTLSAMILHELRHLLFLKQGASDFNAGSREWCRTQLALPVGGSLLEGADKASLQTGLSFR